MVAQGVSKDCIPALLVLFDYFPDNLTLPADGSWCTSSELEYEKDSFRTPLKNRISQDVKSAMQSDLHEDMKFTSEMK